MTIEPFKSASELRRGSVRFPDPKSLLKTSSGGARMVLAISRFAAIVCIGLVAGIYFGYRTGAYYALKELDDSAFIRFQQVVHIYYDVLLPPVVMTALGAALVWLFMVRSQRKSLEFWLIAASVCGILAVVGMTVAVNLPLNEHLMTWNAAAPPQNVREIWVPWDRVNTARTVIAIITLVLEAIVLSRVTTTAAIRSPNAVEQTRRA